MISELISGQSVQIRTANIDDAEFSLKLRQNKEIAKYMPSFEGNIDTQKAWIEKQRASDDCYFFIVESIQGERIGVYSLYNIKDNTAESGRTILIGNPIQNMEANIMLFEFAFVHLHLKKVSMYIYSKNIAAIGVSLRMGSVESGRSYSDVAHDEIIEFVLHDYQYLQRREQLLSLVNRFGRR